ncbi:MAG TPA: hypothetical protein VKX17_22055 [Planctomycetota bacterium]|nr:hypothetical protein [Planctomycetota bacterium]
MTIRRISALIAILALALVARAADKPAGPPAGPLQQILEHAKELGLTDDQKTKIEALIKENGAAGPGAFREKLREHPELLKEMKEARDSGDETKIKEVRAKIAEKLGMKDAGGPAAAADGKRGEIIGKLAQILTPDQMQKLKEFRQERMANGAGAGRGNKNDNSNSNSNSNNKPDTSKGAPSVFDN